MTGLLLSLAERVIRAAGGDHPADKILRDVLRAERGLPGEHATCVSRAVFGYYRWRGWLDPHEPLSAQIESERPRPDGTPRRRIAPADEPCDRRKRPLRRRVWLTARREQMARP